MQDDPYGPDEYTALLTIMVGPAERYLAYLTPAGNPKLIAPELGGYTYGTYYAPTTNNRLVGEDMYGPNGIVWIDLETGTVYTRTSREPEQWLIYPEISPDGRWVAYIEYTSSGRQLTTWNVETGTVYTITKELNHSAPIPAFWSTDTGKVYWQWGKPASEACCYGLWTANPVGGEPHKLVERDYNYWRLSPDGQRVALSGYNAGLAPGFRYGDMGSSTNEVLLLDLFPHEVSFWHPTWCEDGDSLVYFENHVLWRMNLSTGEQTRLGGVVGASVVTVLACR